MKKMSIEQSRSDDLSEQRENSCMAAEDENMLQQKYTTVHEVGAVFCSDIGDLSSRT